MDKHKFIFTPSTLQVREAEGGNESRVIEGCAVVFNQETTLWDGKYERIREVISPSCFSQEFLAEQDIKLNLLHNRDASIARCNKGVGTLQLDLREDGLYFKAEMPKCDLGDRAMALVGNGTYTGCSFEFFEGDYTEERTTLPDGREDVLITHKSMESVTALTIALDPAYEQTSVAVREAQQREAEVESHSIEAAAKADKEEQEKRERIRKQVKALRDLAN